MFEGTVFEAKYFDFLIYFVGACFQRISKEVDFMMKLSDCHVIEEAYPLAFNLVVQAFFDKIRGHEEGCIKPRKSWDTLLINWCRISSINSIYIRSWYIYCIIIENYKFSLTIKPFLKVSKKRPWSKDSKRWKVSVTQTGVDGPCYLSSCIQVGKLHHRRETSCKKAKHLRGYCLYGLLKASGTGIAPYLYITYI